MVGRLRDDLGRLPARRAAALPHARRPHRTRRGHSAGDPDGGTDPVHRLRRARGVDPRPQGAAPGRAPLRIGDALLGPVRLRGVLRRVVLRPGLPGRHAPVHAPRRPPGLRVGRADGVRAGPRARNRRGADGRRPGRRRGPDGEPHAHPGPRPDAGRARMRAMASTPGRYRLPPAEASPAPCW